MEAEVKKEVEVVGEPTREARTVLAGQQSRYVPGRVEELLKLYLEAVIQPTGSLSICPGTR